MRTSPARSASQPRQITGRTVLFSLIGFFALVAGVNAVMIRAAVSTFGGVETENAYQAGLHFAQELAAVEAQDALHWQVRGNVSSNSATTAIRVTAAGADGRPLPGLQATSRLVHPIDRRADRTAVLKEESPGNFAGQTEAVAGQWLLVIELSRQGNRLFRSTNRVFVPAR